MLIVSYVAAAAAMLGAALYLFFRLRLYLTTTTMLIGSLLLIYGPAFLSYTLSSGESVFLINRLRGLVGLPNPLFSTIKAKVSDFDAVIVAMNFSIALMYVSIIAGIEAVDRFFPNRISRMRTAVTVWSSQSIRDDAGGHRILLIVIFALASLMVFFSITENHLATIKTFLSLGDGNNAARDLYRLHFATSPNYLYRLILSGVAPMFVIWGVLAGSLSKSWWLLLAALLLFIATMIGKFDTLSKAPPAFFMVQLMVAALLAFTNRITWLSALIAGCFVALILYAVTRLIMIFPEGTAIFQVVYYRVFEVENQALLENFGTFPFVHPHMWGANIRPIANLLGLHFIPSYSIVAHTWYGTYDVTSPSLFIADAWTDFSFAGVFVFSVIAGAVCRSIDAIFLAHGKTVVSVAVLGATFAGIFTLLTTALNTALLSGGLLLAPVLAGLLVIAIRHFGQRRPRTQ